jgi:tetratricopeptide (TPR) repeat protein
MKKSLFVSALLGAVLAVTPPARAAASNPPRPPPSGGGSSGAESRPSRNDPPELSFFTDGTQMLFKKQWAAAQTQLEAAIAINEKMAEAHNNLAYVLRKQGEANYARSLEHYNRAIELKPKMAEAYMYRGALYVLMGKAGLAQADYDTLVGMKSKLAPALKKIMDTGKEEEPEQFYGVIKKKK